MERMFLVLRRARSKADPRFSTLQTPILSARDGRWCRCLIVFVCIDIAEENVRMNAAMYT